MKRRIAHLVILLIVGSVAVLAVTTDLGSERDVGLVAGGHASARADPRIRVLLVDRAFLKDSDSTSSAWLGLVTGLLGFPPRTTVVMPDVVAAATKRLTTSDLAKIGPNLDLSEILALFLSGTHGVVLGYEASNAGSRFGIPGARAAYPAASLANVIDATGLAPAPLGRSGTSRWLLPLAARAVPAASPRTLLPAVAVAAALRSLDPTPPRLRFDGRHVEIGNQRIPVEETVGLRVNYSRALLPGGQQVVRAREFWRNERPYSELAGKIVVFGVYEGEAGAVPAPVSGGGVAPAFVTANAINTLLTRQYLVRESPTRNVVTGLLFVVLAAGLWAFAPWWIALIGCGLAAAAWWAYAARSIDHGQILSVLGPIGALVVITVGGLVILWVGILRHRRKVSGLFARYVPARVAHQLLEGDLAEELAAGRRHDLTVLFVDLRGFTPLSATLNPPDIRRLLDHFYEYVSLRVLEHEGTVVQFIGDEVYAVFGAPVDRSDHAAAGLFVARALQGDLAELDRILADDDLPVVRLGVGVHSGPAVGAHVGTSTRSQYTVIGDTVNVASRLCSLADAGQVVTSATTFDAAATSGFASVGRYQLKGVAEPVPLYVYGPGVPRGARPVEEERAK